MKLSKPIFKLVIFIVILTPILDILLGKDYTITLPNKYSLSCVRGGVFMTNPRSVIIVSPDIDGYKVSDNIVVGHVSGKNLTVMNMGYSMPGYFIVNTKNGAIQKGLDEDIWAEFLPRYGVTKKLNLSKPSILDEYISKNGPRLLTQRVKGLILDTQSALCKLAPDK